MANSHVIFHDSPKPFLWFLRKGFKHVSVILRVHDHRTGEFVTRVHMDFRRRGFDITSVRPKDLRRMMAWENRENYTVIKTPKREPTGNAALPTPHTCVSATKKILGIKAWWVLTPHQLYKYLNHSNKEE